MCCKPRWFIILLNSPAPTCSSTLEICCGTRLLSGSRPCCHASPFRQKIYSINSRRCVSLMQTTVLVLSSYYIYRMELTLRFIQFNHSRIAWQGVVLCNVLNKFENKKTKSRRASNLFFARCADDHKTSDRKVSISYLWLWHLVPQITSSSIPSGMCRENIQKFLRGAKRYGVRGREYGAVIVFVSVSYWAY